MALDDIQIDEKRIFGHIAKLSYLLSTLGVGGVGGVLVIAGLGGETLGRSASILFTLGLLLVLFGSIGLFASNNRRRGTFVLIVAIVLFAISWLSLFGKHWEPRGGYHRHPIWHLGHMH